MSTLIPSITSCKFDTSGERRFARLLEAKLEDDYLCWYNGAIRKPVSRNGATKSIIQL